MSSVENYEIVPVVEEKKAGSKSEEDLTSQLLGCINEYKIDPVVDKENVTKQMTLSQRKRRCYMNS